MKQLEVKNIAVSFSGKTIIQNISFSLERGSIGCLLGPSGCGKTTLLRTIAGFELPTDGQIFIGGKEVSHPGWATAPEQRRIGMVFQDFALFPHLSVNDNIAFGLKGLHSNERIDRVNSLLQMVGLPDSGKVYPHQLSGGQQQRVALARALAPEPEVLLLDEPFSSMDTELRQQLASEVLEILRQANITTIFVTHDQSEAFTLADEIGVMSIGKFEQWDSAYELYYQPANHFVADFIGEGVFIPGIVMEEGRIDTSLGIVTGTKMAGFNINDQVDVLIRPNGITHDENSRIRAKVINKIFQGDFFRYRLQLADDSLVLCVIPSRYNFTINAEIGIRLECRNLVVFCSRHSR